MKVLAYALMFGMIVINTNVPCIASDDERSFETNRMRKLASAKARAETQTPRRLFDLSDINPDRREESGEGVPLTTPEATVGTASGAAASHDDSIASADDEAEAGDGSTKAKKPNKRDAKRAGREERKAELGKMRAVPGEHRTKAALLRALTQARENSQI